MTYLTTREAADLLRLTPATLATYATTGQIEASLVGRHYLFSNDALAAFVEKRKV